MLEYSQASIVQKLRTFPLMMGIPDSYLQQIAPFIEGQLLKKGTLLLEKGQINQHVYLLIKGKVQVQIDEEAIATLSELGAILGEISVITGQPSSADLYCLSDVEVFAIHSKHIGSYYDMDFNVVSFLFYKIFALELGHRLVNTTRRAHEYQFERKALLHDQDELKSARELLSSQLTEVYHSYESALASLKWTQQVQSLVSELSNNLTHLPQSEIQSGLDEALFKLGTFFKATEVGIYEFSENEAFVRRTHCWPYQSKESSDEPILSWYSKKLSFLSHPKGSLSQEDSSAQTLPYLFVPMIAGQEFIGFLGIDEVHSEALLEHDILSFTSLLGEVFANVLIRQKKDSLLLQQEVALETERQLTSAKEQFFAMVTHELRTPLHAILGFSERIQARIKQGNLEKALEHAQLIYRSGRRLLNLVNDLLDISKIQADGMSLAKEPTQIVDMIEGVFEQLSPLAEEAKVSLVLDVAKKPALFNMDALRISQVLLNLIANAIAASEPDSEVRIKAFTQKKKLHVQVIDTGKGIPEDALAKIFNSFFQAPNRNKRVESTGLGLNIAKRLIEMHGGTLTVESVASQGSTFTFCLPA